MLWPASRAGPGRTASASRRLRCLQPAHRPAAAPRATAVPTESCDSDAPGRCLCRPGPEAGGQARPGQGDSDDSDAHGCGHGGPGQCPRQARPGPDDSDTSGRVGCAADKEITSLTRTYQADRPSTRDTPTPSMRRRPRPGRGRALRRHGSAPSARQDQPRDCRQRPDAAPGPALDCSYNWLICLSQAL